MRACVCEREINRERLGWGQEEAIFTTQHVRLSPGTVGCGTHAGEVQRVAQHGVHPAEDVRVAAGGEGRRLDVGVLQPARVVSLREGKTHSVYGDK